MKKVLIVEDNEMNRDMLSLRLQRKGFEIELAVNGEDALLKVKEYLPDIILMDMNLPIMDGWEATKYLKQQEENKKIPIVGLSAHAREADKIRGMEAGCDAYETKPIDIEKLTSTINGLLTN